MCSSDIFLGLLAILFPPIAVWIKRSICSADSLINLALCTLGYIPGLLHAWYIIARYPDDERYEYETIPSEGTPTTPHTGPAPSSGGGRARGERQADRPQGNGERGYGTNEGVREGQGERGQGGVGGSQRQGQEQGQGQGQEDGDGGVPPSYDQAVKGDHKVQT